MAACNEEQFTHARRALNPKRRQTRSAEGTRVALYHSDIAPGGTGKLFYEKAGSAVWLEARQHQAAAWAQVSCRQIQKAVVRGTLVLAGGH
jgi:hypothetical protein